MKKNIKELFQKYERPEIGSIVTLMHIMNQYKYTRREILKAFNKLVSIDEYASNEKRQIIDILFKTSQKTA